MTVHGQPKSLQDTPEWSLESLFNGDCPLKIDEMLRSTQARLETLGEALETGTDAASMLNELADIVDNLQRIETYTRLTSAVSEDDLEIQSDMQCIESTTRSLMDQVLSCLDVFEEGSGSTPAQPFKNLLEVHKRQNRYRLASIYKTLISDMTPGSFEALKQTRTASLRTLGPSADADLSAQRRDLYSNCAGTRKEAWSSASEMLRSRRDIHAQIYNGWLSLSNSKAKWGGAPNAPAVRHSKNNMDPEIVDVLCASVRAGYTDYSHRYFKLKARLLGTETLSLADRLAPIHVQTQLHFSWTEAKTLILDSFAKMGDVYLSAAQAFFENDWIDARPRPGKNSGGFCLPGPSSANPFILLNFKGSARCVLELAHELGHGIHYLLSQPSNKLGIEVPFPIAETAAIFAEQLTFTHMTAEHSPDASSKLLLGRAHDVMNTVFRHMALYDFEVKAHEARKSGLLSAQYLETLYEKVHREALGDAFVYDGSLGPWYFTVPHFFNWTFYTYAYAFGELVAGLLHKQCNEDPVGFCEPYLDFLGNGGSQDPTQLLSPFKIDLHSPSTWSAGLSTFDPLMEEIYTLS